MTDKSVLSSKWEEDIERAQERLTRFAHECGFTAVDFGTGLVPVLRNEKNDTIIVPGSGN